jgi:hypothetical protein
MKKYGFIAEFKVNIDFTDKEFDLIFDNASHHYDNTVKLATIPGPSAFLHGMKNRRNWEKTSGDSPDYAYNWDLSSRDLNLMLKAIEFDSSDEAQKLYHKLASIFKEMQEANKRFNDTLSPKILNEE